jgi:ribosomal protein S18 acetylase RimI-like enzyme
MVIYRNTVEADLNKIAKIHKQRFPDHYLGKFSVSLLYKFYKNLLDSNQIFLVAEEDNKIVGFVVGGDIKVIKERLNLFIKRNVLYYSLEILVRPNTWSKSIEKIKRMFIKQPEGYYNLDDYEPYTLLSIATALEAQGKGVGSGLIKAFDNEISKIGNHYHLAVMESNISAIKFYEKNGFEIANKLPDELQMMKYIKES